MARAAKALKPPPCDPFVGRKVKILAGSNLNKTGTVHRTFTGRAVTPDHVFVELDGALPGYFVSIPIADVRVQS